MKWERGTSVPRQWRFVTALAEELEAPLADVSRLCGKDQVQQRTKRPRESFVPLAVEEWPLAGFGATLRSLRRSSGKTQTEVGHELGVTGGAVSTWDLGSAYPSSSETVSALERYFGTAPRALAELIPRPPSRLGSRAQRITGLCACDRDYNALGPGELAHLIAHRRLDLGLSQEALARRLSTNQGVISKWERGDALPLRSRSAELARALNVPTEVVVATHPDMISAGRFASAVVSYRLRNGLTQAQAAERLGCTQAAVSKWERGSSVPWPTQIRHLAAELAVPREELLTMLSGGLAMRPRASAP
jgi:transcriptional regulator with XRE-family HTH domain